tara:strand:- start:350 stop:616 length:267 start_codon:yes stop_codon:yes gene_type:complete
MTSKALKKCMRILRYVDMVVEVGEVVSTKMIVERMNTRTGLPTKRGTIPACYIPSSSTSLGIRMRSAKNFEKMPRGNSKSHNLWRRIE